MSYRALIYSLSAAAALTIVSCGHHHSPLAPSDLHVTGVTPATGSSFGGTGVTVHGDGFAPGATVSFGGVPGTNVVILDAQDLTVVTPAHVVGVVPVTVTLGGRTAGVVGAFTFGSPTGSGANAPPVIQSITSTGPHPNQPSQYAEAREALTIMAMVADNETSPDALQYDWSAPEGSFSGEGATVTWQPPAKTPPFDDTITLTVTEHFKIADEHGLPVDQTNIVTSTFEVFVHEAKSEVGDMGQDFLDRFSDSNLGPDNVLHNFDPDCLNTSNSERDDVIQNRATFKILTHSIQNLSDRFTLNFGGICSGIGLGKARAGDACAYYQAHWTQTLIDGTPTGPSDGVDQVAALYKNNRWVLCTSEFVSPNGLNTMFKR